MSLDEKQLKEKMEMILDFMVENKLISQTACDQMKDEMKQEDSTLGTMIKDMASSGIEKEDICNEQFQKKLMGTLVSHSLGMKDAATLGITMLTTALELKDKESKSLEETLSDPKLTKELDKMQSLHVLVSNKLIMENLHPSPKPTPEAKAKADKTLENKLGNNKEEKEKIQKLSKEIERQAAEARRNAYGGDDPTITGEVQSVVQVIITEIADWFEPPADPNAQSARVKEASITSPEINPQDSAKKSGVELASELLSPLAETLTDELDAADRRPKPQMHHQ